MDKPAQKTPLRFAADASFHNQTTLRALGDLERKLAMAGSPQERERVVSLMGLLSRVRKELKDLEERLTV